MAKYSGINASYTNGNKKINVDLSLLYWEEENIHFYYSPALDLTGYGTTEEEAKESFLVVLEEFVRYTDNKKTIYAELDKLGWTTNPRKKRALPPTEEQLIEDNETYKELLTKPNIQKTQQAVAF